jgi:hypothetical protein
MYEDSPVGDHRAHARRRAGRGDGAHPPGPHAPRPHVRPHAEPSVPLRLALATERSGLNAEVLRLAVRAHANAVALGLTRTPLLTVIDYGLPSREKRL